MRIPQVLIAEDDLTLQKLLLKALQSTEYHVMGINDGREVLQYLQMGLPDLMILDWGLPNANGLQILQYLRRHDSQRKMKLIVMTGNQAATKSEEARYADLVLLKPVGIRDLTSAVQNILSPYNLSGVA